MLSALILFVLAIGSVKGFAFTLGLTTLIDVLVVFMFTKPLVTLLARTRFFGGGHRLSGLDPAHLGVKALPGVRTRRPVAEGSLMAKLSNLTSRLYTGEISYDFIGHRRRWYIVSAILITLSILAMLIRGLVFGIEFRGGADFKAPTQVTAQTVDQVRAAVVATGLPELDDTIVNTIGERPGPGADPDPGPDDRGAGGPRRDRRGGRGAARPGRLQPDRRLLGQPDHRAGPDRPGGVPGPGRAGHLDLLPRRKMSVPP